MWRGGQVVVVSTHLVYVTIQVQSVMLSQYRSTARVRGVLMAVV